MTTMSISLLLSVAAAKEEEASMWGRAVVTEEEVGVRAW
jgi:hypothetical protein